MTYPLADCGDRPEKPVPDRDGTYTRLGHPLLADRRLLPGNRNRVLRRRLPVCEAHGVGEEATGERSFSSRDEWELMYRNGLSPAVIARTCNVPVATVNRTLGRRAREDPRLRDEHLSNAPETPVDVPTPDWTARLREFQAFLKENGRPPGTAAGSRPAERSLARWLSTQRTLHKQGKLSEARIRHLDHAGPWRSSYRQDRDERHWQQCLTRLARFRAIGGRWPAWKNPSGEDERQLGTWLHGQRQAASQGRLSSAHREQLDSLIPGWNTWRTPI